MPLPPVIQTVTVNFGPMLDFQGQPLRGSTTFEPSTPIMAVATGTPILNRPITVEWDVDGMGSVILPASDSVGINVSGFTYRVTHRTFDAAAPAPTGGSIVLPAAAPSVDLDVLVPTTAANGVVIDQPAVVSVAGMAGAITATDLAGALGDTFVAKVPKPSGNPAADTTKILSLVTAAQAAGGGRLIFPAATYTLTQTLPVVSGVSYIGVPPILLQTTVSRPSYTPDGYWSYTGGTVLQGDGTFACFSGNATDVSNPSGANLGASEISGVEISGFGLQHFSYGVKVGATDIAGLLWSRLDDLFIRDCSQWGVYLANYQHLTVGKIVTSECVVGGQRYTERITGSGPFYGNTLFRDLYHKTQNQRLARGIVFDSFGGNSATLGETVVHRLQCNHYNRTVLSVTATLTSGSANIAVPDGTQFAVGLPVTFSASANGFSTNTTYMVQSVTGNTITVGLSKSTAAITASGSGTPTLTSWGMPNVEFVGYNSSALLSGVRVHDIDAEGASGAGIYLENVTLSDLNIAAVPIEGTQAHIVSRNSRNMRVYSSPIAVTDFDSPSTADSFYYGARGATWGFPLQGMWFDNTINTNCLAIGPGSPGQVGGDIQRRGNNSLYPSAGMGERITPRASGTTLNGTHTGDVVYTGSSAATFTLPTVSDASATSTTVGFWYEIFNCSTGTITVNTDGTQLLNQVSGRTSTTIAPGNSLKLIAVKDAAGAYWWAARASALVA